MKNFFAYFKKNWLTTLIGAAQLASVSYAAYHDPTTLATPGALGQIATGLTLVGARDPGVVNTILNMAGGAAPDKTP